MHALLQLLQPIVLGTGPEKKKKNEDLELY